jgi:hypothetical protein
MASVYMYKSQHSDGSPAIYVKALAYVRSEDIGIGSTRGHLFSVFYLLFQIHGNRGRASECWDLQYAKNTGEYVEYQSNTQSRSLLTSRALTFILFYNINSADGSIVQFSPD